MKTLPEVNYETMLIIAATYAFITKLAQLCKVIIFTVYKMLFLERVEI